MRSAVTDIAATPVRNLVPYPNFDTGTQGWARGTTSSTVYWDPDVRHSLTGGSARVETLGSQSRERITSNSAGSPAVQQGMPYVLSAWFKGDMGVDYELVGDAYIDGNYNNGSVSKRFTATGQWERVITPAYVPKDGTNRLSLHLRTAVAVVTTFWLDEVMLTLGTQVTPFADGNKPEWRWEGAAGASTSVGYVPSPNLIQNRVTAPKGTAFEVYSTGTLSLATGITHAPGSTTTAIRVAHSTTSNSGASFPINRKIAYGETVSVGCWVYRESGAEYETIGVAIYGVVSGGAQSIPLNKWVLIRSTLTHNNTGTNAGPQFTGVRIAAPTSAGSFLVTNIFTMDGAYTGPFVCGDTPGWRWLGIANASASEGYPYTLEGAAGIVATADILGDIDRVILPLGTPDGSPVTIISFVNRLADESIGGFTPFIQFGKYPFTALDNSHFWLRSIANATTQNLQLRVNGAGPTAVGQSPMGQHIASAGVDGLGRQFVYANNKTPTMGNLDMLSLVHDSVRVASSPRTSVIRTLVYGELDLTARAAVVRWLANFYGLTI